MQAMRTQESSYNVEYEPRIASSRGMGWLRLVGSLKSWFSFAEYSLFYRALLQKRPIILRRLLIVATPYLPTPSALPRSDNCSDYCGALYFHVQTTQIWAWQYSDIQARFAHCFWTSLYCDSRIMSRPDTIFADHSEAQEVRLGSTPSFVLRPLSKAQKQKRGWGKGGVWDCDKNVIHQSHSKHHKHTAHKIECTAYNIVEYVFTLNGKILRISF